MNLMRAWIFGLLFSAVAAFGETSPDALVKTTTEEVIAAIKSDKDIQGGNKAKIYALVDEKVLPHFDFERMTQLAMGKNWKKATPEQQQVLTKEFRQLLVRTYAVSLTQYRDQKVDYKPAKLQAADAEATVKTEFKPPTGEAVAVEYAMHKSQDGWKVFDIVVEGVSLVINYRSTFNDQIKNNGVDGLIKMLSDRNKAAESKT